MPELPDVEVVRWRLRAALTGATIVSASSADRHILRPQSPRTFARTLTGRTIRKVDRRGKWLRIVLEDGSRLFSHLGMTGWWTRCAREAPRQQWERARIDVRKKRISGSVRYVDARRFGRLIVSKDDIPEWRALGPDPLNDRLRAADLGKALARTRRSVKEAIMDQTVLAGVGNILATEGLWHARIDPRSSSDGLSKADVRAVARGLRVAIRRELAERRTAPGADEWHDVFAVYGRAGAPCPREGATILSAVIAGRTTAFCKVCQVLRGSPSTNRN